MGEVLQSIWFLKVEYDKAKAYKWLSQHGHSDKRPLSSRGSHWEYVIRPTNLFAPNSLRKKPVDGITFIYGRYRVGQKGLKTGINVSKGIKEKGHPLIDAPRRIKSPAEQEKQREAFQKFFRNTIIPIMGTEGLSGEHNRRKRDWAPSGIAHETEAYYGDGIKKKGMGGFKV